MLRIITALSLFILSLPFCFSQEKKTWSLEDCIGYAMEHSDDVKKQLLTYKEKEIQLNDNKWSFVPSLSASVGGTISSGRVLDPTTYQFVHTNYTANTNSGISANIHLFEGGKKIFSLQKAKLDLDVSQLEKEELSFNIKLNVLIAYLDILCSKEHLKSLEVTVDKFEAQLIKSKTLYETGLITEADILHLQSQLLSARNDATSARNSHKIAQITLCNLLGFDDYESFSIIEPMESSDMTLLNTDKIIEEHPSVRITDMRRQLAQNDIKIARSLYSPSLILSAGYGTNYSDARKKTIISPDGNISQESYPFFQQYADNASVYATLTLSIPILNGMKARNSVKRAKLSVEHARISHDQAVRKLKKDLIQAQIEYTASLEQYELAKQQVKYSEAVEKQLNDRYNLGAVDFNSWNTSVAELAQSQFSLTESKYTCILRAELLKLY